MAFSQENEGGIVKTPKIAENSPSVSFADSSLPEGAYGRARPSLGVWALPDVPL